MLDGGPHGAALVADPHVPEADAAKLLYQILRALEPPDELYDLPIYSASHVKIKCKYIVLTPSVAQIVTVKIGTFSRTFAISSIDTRIFPFPFTVERGVDVVVSASAGTVSGYIVAMPQNERDQDAAWK